MSTALQSITLVQETGGDIYAPLITVTTGDLFQRYDTDGVYPDWEADATKCPVMTFHLMSSVSQNGVETVPDNILLYYDGVQVVFNAGQTLNAASGGIPAGMFQIIGGGSSPYQVKVLKNFCTKGSTVQAGHNITIVGLVGVNRYPASCPVDIQVRTENGEEVHIIGEGANPFVVDQNTGSTTTLIAQVYSGGVPVAAGTRTFKWEKLTATGWVTVSAAAVNNDRLVVKASDVEAYAIYRVTVTNGSLTYMDTQSVMDSGDPFYVGITVTDGSAAADPRFPVGAAATDKRVFTASLLARHSGATIPSSTTTWQLQRTDGTILNNSFTGGKDTHGVIDRTQKSASITVPLSFMTDNNVKSLQVTAFVEFSLT